jgi:hypothetical protein
VPIPEKRELCRFCEVDGWEKTEATRPDHHRYRKRLEDGTVLRTKVSLGRGPACGDPALWNQIWRHQLALKSEDQFWEVLDTGQPAVRGEPPEPLPEPQMDAWLFEALVHTVGVDEADVRGMDGDEALARYLAFCERGGGKPG